MERVRPPRSSDDAVPETIGPLPSTRSLNVLLGELRSPGVTQADVEELLRGLARPLAEGESARARADFVLSVIEAPDMGDLLGKDGLTVRAAAVKALLDLGYPYALEIPPEALTDIQGTRQEELAPLRLPIPGILATLAGFLAQSVQCLPSVINSLRHLDYEPAPLVLLALVALLGPAPLAVLAGLLRMTRLLKGALVTMGITGAIWTLLFVVQTFGGASHPFRDPLTSVSLVAALGFLVGALLMLPSDWKSEAEKPEGPQPSSTP